MQTLNLHLCAQALTDQAKSATPIVWGLILYIGLCFLIYRRLNPKL